MTRLLLLRLLLPMVRSWLNSTAQLTCVLLVMAGLLRQPAAAAPDASTMAVGSSAITAASDLAELLLNAPPGDAIRVAPVSKPLERGVEPRLTSGDADLRPVWVATALRVVPMAIDLRAAGPVWVGVVELRL